MKWLYSHSKDELFPMSTRLKQKCLFFAINRDKYQAVAINVNTGDVFSERADLVIGEKLFISVENFLFGDVSIQACPRLIPIITLPHNVFRFRFIGADTVIIPTAFLFVWRYASSILGSLFRISYFSAISV